MVSAPQDLATPSATQPAASGENAVRSWVSDRLTDLCESRLQFLDAGLADGLYNATVCARDRAELVSTASQSALSSEPAKRGPSTPSALAS